MMAGFWMLLVARSPGRCGARASRRGRFVLAGCAALAVGTFQGPVQAFPAVNELLDRSGDAGDVIVNLHAQLNMLGGLMPILLGLALVLLAEAVGRGLRSCRKLAVAAVSSGVGVYYAAGIAFAAIEAPARDGAGTSFGARGGRRSSRGPALVLVPAALAVGVGFGAYARTTWAPDRRLPRDGARGGCGPPRRLHGRIPRRVRRLSPGALAAYELPMGLLGFPGRRLALRRLPGHGARSCSRSGPRSRGRSSRSRSRRSGKGPLRDVGWQVEFAWLPLSALLSAAMLYRAHRRRLRRLDGPPPRGGACAPHRSRRSGVRAAGARGRRGRGSGGRRDHRARPGRAAARARGERRRLEAAALLVRDPLHARRSPASS